MMRLIKNGEPVIHKHKCIAERFGKEMTHEELHDFAVEVLWTSIHRQMRQLSDTAEKWQAMQIFGSLAPCTKRSTSWSFMTTT